MALQVILHPLPVLNISEHYTRINLNQNNATGKVYGGLLGTHNGRNLEIANSFEFKVDDDNKIDTAFLEKRKDQFKQVFPSFDLLGWYTVGEKPTQADLNIHEQIIQYNESALFLQLDPKASSHTVSNDLPLTVYSSNIEIIDNTPKTTFTPISYTMETGEAERIALDHTAKPSLPDSTSETAGAIAGLHNQKNALRMLHDRLRTIFEYVQQVIDKKIEPDPKILRQISSLVSSVPSTKSDEFNSEYNKEYIDVMLTSYLSNITQNLHDLNQLIDLTKFANQANNSNLKSAAAQHHAGMKSPTFY